MEYRRRSFPLAQFLDYYFKKLVLLIYLMCFRLSFDLHVCWWVVFFWHVDFNNIGDFSVCILQKITKSRHYERGFCYLFIIIFFEYFGILCLVKNILSVYEYFLWGIRPSLKYIASILRQSSMLIQGLHWELLWQIHKSQLCSLHTRNFSHLLKFSHTR